MFEVSRSAGDRRQSVSYGKRDQQSYVKDEGHVKLQRAIRDLDIEQSLWAR